MKGIDTDKELLAVIGRNPLFRGLDPEAVAEALEFMGASKRSYKKGEVIHPAGVLMPRFGLVVRGCAQACAADIEGSRMILAEVPAGATFGESLCYLRIADSPVYVIAPENAEILWLSPERLFSGDASRLATEMQRRFTGMLAARTLTMNNRIQILSKLTLREKLVTYFSELSASAGSSTFNIPMKREDMAAYIGSDRCALSRELSKMKAEGIIDYYRNTVKLLAK